MQVKNILVDLDGTLVQGDNITMRFDFIRQMTRSWSQYGGALKVLQAFHRMRSSVESPPFDLTNDQRMIREFANTFQLPREEAAKILEKTVTETFSKLGRHFSPVPGAADFIGWAKIRYSLFLATNPIWLREVVEFRVRWAGLELDDFVSVTHAQRMHSCKPRVEYYQELIQQEKLDPSTCFMIGNERSKDLPASKLGIPVYILSKEPHSPKKDIIPIPSMKAGTRAWMGSFAGLKQLLSELASK